MDLSLCLTNMGGLLLHVDMHVQCSFINPADIIFQVKTLPCKQQFINIPTAIYLSSLLLTINILDFSQLLPAFGADCDACAALWLLLLARVAGLVPLPAISSSSTVERVK